MAKHGRYKIVRKVADGGMAEIFLATQMGHEGFQKPVILKRIHSTIYADPQFRNMFIDEAHISMGLSHSNIVQILDLGVGNGRYFLVMEVVDGWDLGRVLHRAAQAGMPLPRELGLYVTAEVCQALAYAHGKMDAAGERPLGLVHRDVSPQNILLSEQGEVKLTDFGIAKAMGKREQTGTGIVKGKVAFMSPEQALGKPVDARSDLFAVGTILYQLMTGLRPFEAPTDLETLLRVQKAEFRPPEVAAPDLPAHVCAIISRAMQLEPELRYQSAEELLTDLETVLRTVFRPAGQTELKRWLAALSARDGQLPMAKAVASQHTPPHGRLAGAGTGEMEGKDVVLDDVGGEEPTSLASLDTGSEIRPRYTRRTIEELALPVPQDDEAALSGKIGSFNSLELPLPDGDERPRTRRARRGGGFPLVLFGLALVGGAAYAGRYFGLLREKESAVEAPPATVTGEKAAEHGPAKAATHAANTEATADAGAAARKPEKAEKAEKPEKAEKVEKAEKPEKVEKVEKMDDSEAARHPRPAAEKSERARRIDELKNMMAPDPSLDVEKAAPAPPPAGETP